MTTIKLRRGTAAQWLAVDPVLSQSEPGYELDTGKEKRGDGVTHWSSLPYYINERHISAAYETRVKGRQGEGRLAPGVFGIPRLMTSPPDISVTETPSDTSTIPSAITIEPDAAGAASYVGAIATRGSTHPDTLMLGSNFDSVTLTSTYGYPPWYMEFDHDGSVLEMVTRGRTSAFRVLVDGEYAGDRVLNSPVNDGNLYVIKIDFSTRALRRVRIEMNGLFQVGKIFLEPTATIRSAPIPGPRVCILGDSYTEPTIVDSTAGIKLTEHDGWATVMCRMLGWEDRFILGSGGTGYCSPGSNDRVKFRDRVQNDVIDKNPDIVVVAGGLNDAGFDDADVAVEANLLFTEILSDLPAARLYVVSPFYFETPDAGILSRSAAIEAVVPSDAYFIDLLSPPAITGTGDQDNPAANGNADAFIGGDSLHPTFAGHQFLGRLVASLIHQASF